MNSLFCELRAAVRAAQAVRWPMEGNVWFDLIVDVMAEVGFEYPERYLLLEELYVNGEISDDIYAESVEEMQKIIRVAHGRYEERYNAHINALLGKFRASAR